MPSPDFSQGTPPRRLTPQAEDDMRSIQDFFFPPEKFPYLRYVALALIVFYGVGVYWGLPSEFSAAVDSVVPYSPLAFIAEYSRADIAEKYPATHQLLLLPFYVIAFLFLLVTGKLCSPSNS
jgi:hypothetical protein